MCTPEARSKVKSFHHTNIILAMPQYVLPKPRSESSADVCVLKPNVIHVCLVYLCAHTVDGSWGPWSPWAMCSATCGGGLKSRERECNSPVPEHGGRKCMGDSTENEACNKQECPIGKHPRDPLFLLSYCIVYSVFEWFYHSFPI